jgi:hypothetical protein
MTYISGTIRQRKKECTTKIQKVNLSYKQMSLSSHRIRVPIHSLARRSLAGHRAVAHPSLAGHQFRRAPLSRWPPCRRPWASWLASPHPHPWKPPLPLAAPNLGVGQPVARRHQARSRASASSAALPAPSRPPRYGAMSRTGSTRSPWLEV